MKVVLDLHDFSVVNNRLDLLLKLKEHFPKFKVSLFTVPLDESKDWGASTMRHYFLDVIKQNLDWIQIIPHGLKHDGHEMKRTDYMTFKNEIIPMIEEIFDVDGLPYEKGFLAPHFSWTEGIVRVLDEEGWWGAIDRDKVMPVPKKFYRYTWRINEPFLNFDTDVLKIHGHIYGTKNDIGLCMDKILALPQDTEWHFCTDFLETK